MKFIPIRVERDELRRRTRTVEWRLHNVCNFKCSFCGPMCYDGSNRPLDLSVYVKTVARLMEQSKDKIVWFQFTGGEPTLYPELPELLTHVKQLGGYTSLLSNGSRTVRYWQELADKDVLDKLFITHHPEQCLDAQHTIRVNDLMQLESNACVQVFVTAPPAHFDKAASETKEILENAATMVSLRPIIVNNEISKDYTPKQLGVFEEYTQIVSSRLEKMTEKLAYWKSLPSHASMLRVSYSDGYVERLSSQALMSRQENKFKGWECDAGKDLLVINFDQVYRATCMVGGSLGHVSEATWATDHVLCTKDSCGCNLDIQEPKRKTAG